MDKDRDLKNKAASGFVWKLLEKIGSQLMQIVIQILLARLLLPEEYGLVGMLTIFITISDVIILQGLSSALIQKKNCDEIDYSSVFFANIVVSGLLYIILFLLSPSIATFYNDNRLVDLMRVLSLNVIIGAFPAVHNAIMAKELDFRKSFYRNLFNTLTQGIVGVALAIHGFGAWSIVISKISGTIVGAVILMSTVKWRPKPLFSISTIVSLFSFGSKVLGTNLLSTIFNNIHSLIIGHYYTAADLGYYQRGQQFPQAIMSSIDGSLSEVLYPTFSRVQNDRELLKRALRRSIKTSMFIVLPVLFGLFAIAKTFTVVLLTEKWLPSVDYLRLTCIICAFWPLSHRIHAINAIGRSDVSFKLSVVTKVISLVSILVFMKWGIKMIMIGTILSSLIGQVLISIPIEKYIGYSIKNLLTDLLPVLSISILMGVIVTAIDSYLVWHNVLKLFLEVGVGGTIYIFGSYLLKIDSLNYLLDYIRKYIKWGMKK